MERSDKPCVESKTLAEHVKCTFIPHIMTVRPEERIEEEEVFLLMDNCPSHTTLELIDLLTRVIPTAAAFTPNTPHVSQVLDVILSGSSNVRERTVSPSTCSR
jgi:hypothetical protein